MLLHNKMDLAMEDAKGLATAVSCACHIFQEWCRGKSYLHVRCPEGKVVTQQLHDQGAVLVRLLSKGVQLCNCLIKGLHPTPSLLSCHIQGPEGLS